MNRINYGCHYVDKDDLNEIKKSLFSTKITQGDYVKKFENKIKKIYGAKYCVSVNNGTSALILAIKSLRLKKNSKIITTPNTFMGTATSIIINNLKPVFVDIENDTFNIDPKKIEIKLRKDKSIKAIIAVDYAGHPCDWEYLNLLKRKYNIFLINDNCHSLGSKINNNNQYAIKYADIVTQSYHPVKHFTTGEGGSIITNNSKVYNFLIEARNHGIIKNKKTLKKGQWYYDAINLSQNYRLSDINCALGYSQIKKLNKFIKKRRNIAFYYEKNLKNIKGLSLPTVKEGYFHSYHLYPIRINFKFYKTTKKKFFAKLFNKNITPQVHYIPLFLISIFKKLKFNSKNFPNTNRFYNQEVSLPIYYTLKFKEIDYIIKSIKNILKIKQKINVNIKKI